ncbi:RNA 2',3'-cyclic phosphodiesterase [Aliikangiella sp. IMCC44653]
MGKKLSKKSTKHTNSSLNRAFFAIDLSPQEKIKLLELQNQVSESLAAQGIQFSKVATENLHITLCFVGKISDSELELLLDCNPTFDVMPSAIAANTVCYWASSKLIYLSIEDHAGLLSQLKAQIEKTLTCCGIYQFDKKPFIPHITLFRQLSSEPQLFNELATSVQINEVDLMLSNPQQPANRYQSVQSWRLGSLSVKQQLLGKNNNNKH